MLGTENFIYNFVHLKERLESQVLSLQNSNLSTPQVVNFAMLLEELASIATLILNESRGRLNDFKLYEFFHYVKVELHGHYHVISDQNLMANTQIRSAALIKLRDYLLKVDQDVEHITSPKHPTET